MSNTLLPCPFCGSENIVTTDFGASTWFVQCDDCGATFPPFDTETEAIAAWNRRADHIRDTTKKVSNSDRIRSMSDEELAWEFMTFRLDAYGKAKRDETVLPDSQKAILNWLKQPVKED